MYGEESPLVGWSEEVGWINFKGPSNSRNRRNVDLVRILTFMLIQVGYDPHTHTELEDSSKDQSTFLYVKINDLKLCLT